MNKLRIVVPLILIALALCITAVIYFKQEGNTDVIVEHGSDEYEEVVEDLAEVNYEVIGYATSDIVRVAESLNKQGINGIITETLIEECTVEIDEKILSYGTDRYYRVFTETEVYTAVLIDGEVIYWR